MDSSWINPLQTPDFNHFMVWTLNFIEGKRSLDLVYPPWTLFPMIPFALLPYNIARLIFIVLAIVFFGLTARRLGASPLGMGAFVLSPLVFNSLAWGNVEWLALSGFLMPPALGLIMFAMKPQLTVAVVFFYLVEIVRTEQPRWIIRSFFPVMLILIASFFLSGNWILETWTTAHTQDQTMNLSVFPYSVPIGLLLLWKAIQSQNVRWAVAASPMFSPWVTPQTWLVIPLAVANNTRISIIFSVGLWAYVLWQRMGY